MTGLIDSLDVSKRVWPDVESSTDTYAQRFAGAVGQYFLNVQARELMRSVTTCGARKVLDVGGGHGQIVEPLVEVGIDVTVVGSTNDCGNLIRNRYLDEHVGFVKSDLFPLPFEDDAFDVVTSFRIVSHLEDWPALIAELCRVARSAVVIDFAVQTGWDRCAGCVLFAKRAVEPDARSYRTQSISDVVGEFAKCRFQVGRTFRQFALPMALHRLVGMPQMSSSIESALRRAGITRLVGSPAIITAMPRGSNHS